jgi:hypothetical protein
MVKTVRSECSLVFMVIVPSACPGVPAGVNAAQALEFRPAKRLIRMAWLALSNHSPKLRGMKLLWATLLHLVVAGVLGAGILLLMQGKPALLIGGTVVYIALLGKVGCASH